MNTRADKTTRRNRSSSTPKSAIPVIATREPDSASGSGASFTAPERRRAMIAEAAYFRAELRRFEPGHELEDWCGAECDIDRMLAREEIPIAHGD